MEEGGGDTKPLFNINNCRLRSNNYSNIKENLLNISETPQNNNVARNIQFLSGCNPGHSGQLSRPNHSSIGESYSLNGGIPEHPVQASNVNNNSILFPHILYGEVRPIEYGIQGGADQPTQSFTNKELNQPPTGVTVNQKINNKTEILTPKRGKVEITRRKLFNNLQSEEITKDVVPLDTDLEILLINSCQINAIKVQTIINDFLTEKNYSTIFCMTETKVKGHDFQPIGIKMFSKHRGMRDKKGGGAGIGI